MSLTAGQAFIKMSLDDSEVYKGLARLQEAVRKTIQGIGVAIAASGAAVTFSLIPALREASKQADELTRAGVDVSSTAIGQFNQAVTEIKASFRDLKTAIGEAIAPFAAFVAKGLEPVIRGLATFVQSTPDVVLVVAGLGVAATVSGVALTVLFSKFVVGATTAVFMAVSVYKLAQNMRTLAASSSLAAGGVTAANAAMSSGVGSTLKQIPLLGQLGSAFTGLGQSILGLTGRLPVVGTLLGRLFPLFGKVGATLLGAAAGFAAVAVAAVGIGVYFTQMQRQTGALTPLFDALGTVGKRLAAVYFENVAPVFRKFGDLMGGLFGGNISFWSDSIKTLSNFLGSVLVGAAETAAGVIAILSEKVEWLLDSLNRLMGIESKEESPQDIVAKRKAEEAAKAAAAEEEKQKAAQQKLKDESPRFAEQLKEDLKTPLERFQEEMKRLQVALDEGHLNQGQFDAGVERAKQRRKDEEQAEYDQSPAGIIAKEMESFGNNLRESTRTAEEKFEEQMAKIGQAFAAGAVTAEVAQRGMEEAQKALDSERKQIQDEAERQAKAARDAELQHINRIADRRSKVGAAIGGEDGQKVSDATTEDQIKKLQEGGYNAEAFDVVAGYSQSLRSRAEDLKSRIDQQQESTSFTTRSAQEAMFGLSGPAKIDEQLLDEYKEVRRKAEEQTELLKQIFRTLED